MACLQQAVNPKLAMLMDGWGEQQSRAATWGLPWLHWRAVDLGPAAAGAGHPPSSLASRL